MNDLLERQLAYVPEVVGEVVPAPIVVCGGMGGSAFPARIARFLGVTPYIISHQDYGLPQVVLDGARYIALSHSGNTAETLSFAEAILEKGLPLSVIASGGALLALAKERGIAYVEVPTDGVPRDAIVAMTKALLALIGETAAFDMGTAKFSAESAVEEGEAFVAVLEEATPIFYASFRNQVLADLAKILCNETAKVPAFANVFPEMNHNEMQGFGLGSVVPGLVRPFVAVFLTDSTDDARVIRRMQLTEELLQASGVRTKQVALPAGIRTDAFLHMWWMLRSSAQSLARVYGVEADSTPLIEEFKKKL